MKLKGPHFADVAEIQEAATDEWKKVQEEELSAAFQKLYDGAKSCIYANGSYFEKQNVYVFLMFIRFKKISPRTFGPRCVYMKHKALSLHLLDVFHELWEFTATSV
jgi:hypothetical protein